MLTWKAWSWKNSFQTDVAMFCFTCREWTGNINVTKKAAVTGLWVSLPTAARLSLSHRLVVGTRCSLGVCPS